MKGFQMEGFQMEGFLMEGTALVADTPDLFLEVMLVDRLHTHHPTDDGGILELLQEVTMKMYYAYYDAPMQPERSAVG